MPGQSNDRFNFRFSPCHVGKISNNSAVRKSNVVYDIVIFSQIYVSMPSYVFDKLLFRSITFQYCGAGKLPSFSFLGPVT